MHTNKFSKKEGMLVLQSQQVVSNPMLYTKKEGKSPTLGSISHVKRVT